MRLMVADEDGWFLKIIVGQVGDMVFDIGNPLGKFLENPADHLVEPQFVGFAFSSDDQQQKSCNGVDYAKKEEHGEAQDGVDEVAESNRH